MATKYAAKHERNQTLWGPSRIAMLIAAASILGMSNEAAFAVDNGTPIAQPASSDVTNQALLKKLEAMEQRIKSLESQLKQKASAQATDQQVSADTTGSIKPRNKSSKMYDQAAVVPDATPDQPAAKPAKTAKPDRVGDKASDKTGDKAILGMMDSPVPGLAIGAYGEVFFGAVQNPAAGGQWQNSFDARRFVLLPTYAITDNIIFNAEIEFEHAGAGFDNDDKLHGTAEIEQVWVDFKIADPINWRAPGVDLVPIGYINQHHEPTQFYSVFRPELYNGLIPSTWKVPSTSIYGTIVDGLKYQLMLSVANEDFGDSFDNRTDARAVTPGPYFPGIDGLNALGFSNPPLGDFQQLHNSLALSGKLDFTPPSIPGLAWSVSGYYAPNVVPRGAHDDFGNLLGSTSMGVYDAEFRYRIPQTWVELRGEGVYVRFGNPANLRANNDNDPTNNVGKTMYGYSGEAALHIPMGTILNSEWEAVPFYRYTYENFQTGGFAGTDLNMPTGAGQMQFHNVGIAVFPSPKLVLKATYQKVINKDPAGANSDSLLGGVGFFF
jgi:hypothetical protein